MWLAAGVLCAAARRMLDGGRCALVSAALLVGLVLLMSAYGAELGGLLDAGLEPDTHAYGAVVWTFAAWQGVHVCVVLLMTAYTLARLWRGLLHRGRRVTFDNTRLMWYYTAAQGIAAIVLIHGVPRWLS
jgi:cytochrome c oxidase subunit I+III